MPDVPAEMVTVEGETDREKLLEDELELVEPQPETINPSATKASMYERERIRRKRQPIKPASNNPVEPRTGAATGNAGVEEIVVVVALRNAWWAFPLWAEAPEQFAAPV